MKFVDSTEIFVRAGDGGSGMVSFKTARNKPKLGCDGGDGGHGGDVVLVGNRQLNTLSSLRYKKQYQAGHGERGGTNGRTGANGETLLLPVPLGTQVFDPETGKMIAEVLSHQQRVIVAEGGERGLGNQRFVTPTHQAPEEFTEGTSGTSAHLKLELKLIADVGLAGFPNAGKSTLLSVLSSARPKIADYPFTTLVPNLGVVELQGRNEYAIESFVMADVPGLIEGAAEGRGLGHAFLRHLERTKIIAYLVTASNDDEITPVDAFKTLKSELERYSPELAEKPACVILSKIDLIDGDDREAIVARLSDPLEKLGYTVVPVSSVEQVGLDHLKRFLFDRIQEHQVDDPVETNRQVLSPAEKTKGKLAAKIVERWLSTPGIRLELTPAERNDLDEMAHPNIKKLTGKS